MPTVLITGANRGLGLEFARQYLAEGWKVLATCRNPISPGPLSQLQGLLEVHGLDVGDERQIARVAEDLDSVTIDLLINNAGLYGPQKYNLKNIDTQAWSEVFKINSIMPLKIASAFLDNLEAAKKPIIVNVSSMMGSIADNSSGGGYIYRSSKAALNAVMKSLSNDLTNKGIAVYLFHPGWVQTDMGGVNALITPAESVSSIRKILNELTIEDSGSFLNYDGSVVPW